MTAVEFLIEQIKSKADNLPTNTKENRMAKGIYVDCLIMARQALEMEKQQHGETWNAAIQAHENRGFVISRSLCDFDNYFDELKTANK